MKTVKRWMLLMCFAGPMVLGVSCSGNWMQDMRDAAINGAADFVQGKTFDLLNQFVTPDEEEE